MSRLHCFIGIVLWCAVGGMAALAIDRVAPSLWSDVWRYSTGTRRTIDLRFSTPCDLAVGDAVFYRDAKGRLQQAGEVQSLSRGSQTLSDRRAVVRRAQVELYPGKSPSGELQMTYYSAPDSFGWVVGTLLPPARRREIAAELQQAFSAHEDEILAALRPLVEDSLRDVVDVIGQDLPPAIARHRAEFEALGVKYQRDIIDKELVPLAREEIWPIVRRRAEPTANDVGHEIWDRVSLWRFGWRYAYDKSPFPEKRLTQKEWQRFVEEEALPILQAHSDEFVIVVKNTLRDVSKNRRVRESLGRSFSHVVDDPQFQELLWKLFREVIGENPRLRQAMMRRWTTPEARRAVAIASDRMEPTVRHVVDKVIGSRETGITPEFAQVLRNQVLLKDRRWLLVEASTVPTATRPAAVSPSAIDVRIGGETTINPFAPAAASAEHGTR